MLIAGEPSGDRLGAELVQALRTQLLNWQISPEDDVQPLRTALPPEFFGAGGPAMRHAGVHVICDLTRRATIGPFDLLRQLRHYWQAFQLLRAEALSRQPDVIVGIDYGAFNLRLAAAIRRHARRRFDWFHPWDPLLVQYVSPQVWASRPGRARSMQRDLDLLLSILPFEPDWFARHVPRLPVRYVGHPLVDRWADTSRVQPRDLDRPTPRLALLPGSRPDEIRRHGPLLTGAWQRLRQYWPALEARCVVPDEALAHRLRSQGWPAELPVDAGTLQGVLQWADLALTKSGTITLECAMADLPAVVFYKTSTLTYWIGSRIVSVRHLAMPNLLIGETVYPELVQHQATADRLAHLVIQLWQDKNRLAGIRRALARVREVLGPPGAADRAARAILDLLRDKPSALPVHGRSARISALA